GDAFHVRRPRGGGDEIAARLLKGGIEVVAVAGPAGGGKSTEIAQAALLLQDRFVVVQVLLERTLDVQRATEDEVCREVARRIHDIAAKNLGIRLPADLIGLLHAGAAVPAVDLLLRTVREVQRASSQGRLALLLDGLDKCGAEPALRAARALLSAKDK